EDRCSLRGVGNLPVARGHPYEYFAVLADTNGGRCENSSETVRNELSATVPPNADCAVGCTQIDADDHVYRARPSSGALNMTYSWKSCWIPRTTSPRVPLAGNICKAFSLHQFTEWTGSLFRDGRHCLLARQTAIGRPMQRVGVPPRGRIRRIAVLEASFT